MDATSRLTTALRERGHKITSAGRDRYRAQCPAHQGTDLNLAIAKGDQGVLVRCWSHDCAETDIAGAVGLTLPDLFDEGGRAVYDYGGGHRVYRTRTPGGKKIRQEGTPQVTSLYQPSGSTRIVDAGTVILAEGEKTADAIARMGACAATWPGGSSAVGKVDLAPLNGKTVVIVPDNDDPGEKAAATLLWRLQKVAQVKVWRVPELFKGHRLTDAADLWLAGGGLDDFVSDDRVQAVDPAFEEAVAEAQFHESVRWEARRREASKRAALVSDTLTTKNLGDILTMHTTHDWVVEGLLERKDRLVVTAAEGVGKSWLLRQMVVAMAAGVHPFDAMTRVDPVRALVVDTENTEMQWARATKYLTSVVEHHGSGSPRRDVHVAAGIRIDLSVQADVNQVHRLIDQHKPDVLYIGPLYKLVAKAITTDDDAAPLIVALDGFRERGLVLLMEAHAGHAKGAGGARDLRPRGSSALLGWPEFGFGMEQHEDTDAMAWWVPWRGGRESRRWPQLLRKGVSGELPWEVETWR